MPNSAAFRNEFGLCESKMLGTSRQVPDAGVINSKYALVLLGNHQRCQINVWAGALPTEMSWSGSLNKTIEFSWEPNTWYHFKLRVDQASGHAIVKGKVWAKSAAEPQAWTVELDDPMPNVEGSPGLFGESLVAPAASEIYFSNVAVSPNAAPSTCAAGTMMKAWSMSPGASSRVG